MTSRLDRLVVGSDRVAVGEAAGSFDVDRHVVGCRRLVLLAAGTGITPMIRIIRQALESQPETKVRLVFFNRRLEDVIWRDQWQRLVDRHSTDSSDPEAGRFRVWHVLSEAPPAPAAANGGSDDASGRCGRADGEADRWSGRIRRELLDATVLTAAEDGARPASICVCGPTAFTTEALRLLAEAGVDEESVHAFLA